MDRQPPDETVAERQSPVRKSFGLASASFDRVRQDVVGPHLRAVDNWPFSWNYGEFPTGVDTARMVGV